MLCQSQTHHMATLPACAPFLHYPQSPSCSMWWTTFSRLHSHVKASSTCPKPSCDRVLLLLSASSCKTFNKRICSGIATLLADGAADLTAISAQLASQPWVILPGNHFVKPSQLVFVQPGGANAGKIGLHPDLDWLAEDDHHVDTFQLTMSRVHASQVFPEYWLSSLSCLCVSF